MEQFCILQDLNYKIVHTISSQVTVKLSNTLIQGYKNQEVTNQSVTMLEDNSQCAQYTNNHHSHLYEDRTKNKLC